MRPIQRDNSFPGFSALAAGPEAPLEMLAACHGRIEHQCAALERLVPHLLTHGSDQQARSAAVSVMRYFDSAARDHHADEEVDLFPALIESMAGSDAVCIRELIESLSAEHRRLELSWRVVRATLEQIVAGDAEVLDADAVAAFTQTYARHIEREESELLPMAARLLGDAQLDEVGRAMRERRGIGVV